MKLQGGHVQNEELTRARISLQHPCTARLGSAMCAQNCWRTHPFTVVELQNSELLCSLNPCSLTPFAEFSTCAQLGMHAHQPL